MAIIKVANNTKDISFNFWVQEAAKFRRFTIGYRAARFSILWIIFIRMPTTGDAAARSTQE